MRCLILALTLWAWQCMGRKVDDQSCTHEESPDNSSSLLAVQALKDTGRTVQSCSYHLEVPGANKCMRGESPGESSCLEASQKIQTMFGKTAKGPLSVGSWGHAPPGCFLHQPNPVHNPHYNHKATGNNDGRYSLVCEVCDEPPPKFYLETLGANKCVQRELTEAECEAAGNTILEALGRSSKPLKTGSWGHTPRGCFLHAKELKATDHPHWNNHVAGNNDGRWSPICEVDNNKPKVPYYLEIAGSNKCLHGVAVDEATCEAACIELLADLGKWQAGSLTASSWGHTPPGCFMHRGIGNAGQLHYNRKANGDNNGGYSLVCEAVEPLGRWDIVASVSSGSLNHQYQITVTDTKGQTVEIGNSMEITDKMSAGFQFEAIPGQVGVETSSTVTSWMVTTTSSTLSMASSTLLSITCPPKKSKGNHIELYRWMVLVGDKLVNSEQFRCHYTEGATMPPECPFGFCGDSNPLCQEELCPPWQA